MKDISENLSSTSLTSNKPKIASESDIEQYHQLKASQSDQIEIPKASELASM